MVVNIIYITLYNKIIFMCKHSSKLIEVKFKCGLVGAFSRYLCVFGNFKFFSFLCFWLFVGKYLRPTYSETGGRSNQRLLSCWIFLKNSRRFGPLDGEGIPVATSLLSLLFFLLSFLRLFSLSLVLLFLKTHISFLFSFFFSLPRLSRSTQQASSSSSF